MIPDVIKNIARNLRKNMTKAEDILWNHIRNDKLGYRVLRQKPIFVFKEDFGLDRYIIADFYIAELNIVLEIDGSIHDLTEILELDGEKEKLLLNKGIKIIRLKNKNIYSNIEKVMLEIKNKIK